MSKDHKKPQPPTAPAAPATRIVTPPEPQVQTEPPPVHTVAKSRATRFVLERGYKRRWVEGS